MDTLYIWCCGMDFVVIVFYTCCIVSLNISIFLYLYKIYASLISLVACASIFWKSLQAGPTSKDTIIVQVYEKDGLSVLKFWLNRQLIAQEHYKLWVADSIIPVSTISILINLVSEWKRLEPMVKGWWCQVVRKKQCLAGLLEDERRCKT